MTIDLEALYIDLHRHPELSFKRPARLASPPPTCVIWGSRCTRGSA